MTSKMMRAVKTSLIIISEDVDANFQAQALQEIEEIKAQIHQALQENSNVIANTHCTFLGIAELLDLSRDFLPFWLSV